MVAHRDGLSGRTARGTRHMSKEVVSGGRGGEQLDGSVVREIEVGLQKATGGMLPPGRGVEWRHGVNVDKAGAGPLLMLIAPNRGAIQVMGTGADKVGTVSLRRRLAEEWTATPGRATGIDEQGYLLCHGSRVLTPVGRSALSPVEQAFALARTALGAKVPVLDTAKALSKESRPEGNFVCPELTGVAFREMKLLEEEFGVEAVWTLDGSWRHIDEVGMVAASAAARHDGSVVGGRLEEDADGMPLNAYLGELAAQVDWAHTEGKKRILVGFDAVSPVLALLRFRRLHDRSRPACYKDDWLASFSAELCLERFELVIFYHLKSHTGISLNEYADKEAGAAACADFYRRG